MHRRHRPPAKVLFVIKQRLAYGTKTKAYGLVNSCRFVAAQLRSLGIEANVVEVVDNNCIDRVVTEHKPTHCFIEALWVVPSKFTELSRLHPTVKWVVRLHSMIPFLSSEGMAFEWINQYFSLRSQGVDLSVSVNNHRMLDDMSTLFPGMISYTPNIYYGDSDQPTEHFNYPRKDALHIGCFGALRVLKNHPQQAIWAIEFAEAQDRTLWFHVNISEHEQREASPILRNMRAMFANTKHHLIEHLWYNHSDFIELVKQMDIGMQVSFTETFNVVAADFVHAQVPVVVSREIDFVVPECRADATNKREVLNALDAAWHGIPTKPHDRWFGCLSGAVNHARKMGNINHWKRESMLSANALLLQEHNDRATEQWIKVLRGR